MIKKIFITLLLVTGVSLNIIMYITYPKVEENNEIKKKLLDISNTNALIESYSNLFKELIPADEQ